MIDYLSFVKNYPTIGVFLVVDLDQKIIKIGIVSSQKDWSVPSRILGTDIDGVDYMNNYIKGIITICLRNN